MVRMDRAQFEARLRAEGYPEVRENEMQANREGDITLEDIGPRGVKYLVGRRPV
jgi:hypothetical protein